MGEPQFFQTGMGRKFFEAQLPDLIRVVGRLADAATRIADRLDRDAEQRVRDEIGAAPNRPGKERTP